MVENVPLPLDFGPKYGNCFEYVRMYGRHSTPAIGPGFEDIICISFYLLVHIPPKLTNK